jgi:ketosteroid isomerase-like protein
MSNITQANLNTAHALFESLASCNWERMKSLLDEDVLWTIMAKAVPGGAQHQGRDKVVDGFFAPFLSAFVPGGFSIEILRSFATEDEVALETFNSGKLKDGREYENNYGWFLKVRNGKVTDVREYVDTQNAAAQLG